MRNWRREASRRNECSSYMLTATGVLLINLRPSGLEADSLHYRLLQLDVEVLERAENLNEELAEGGVS